MRVIKGKDKVKLRETNGRMKRLKEGKNGIRNGG